MIHFQHIDRDTFLSEYWQKKPLVIRQALPSFISPISAEELAGLSLEPEVESRLVIQHSAQDYQLKTGPFTEQDYAQLPENNWTLLVQGVDKLLPQVHQILQEFDFIPRWRIDDIMISYASEGGNVGPHYDHYDVFLLQGAGVRKWMLTQKNCHPDNYLPDVELRLMQEFEIEEEHLLYPGDLLYLPPKWGHHGVALDNDCITYSVGYRSYKAQELWDSLGDYASENQLFNRLYSDPNWQQAQGSEITQQACLEAKQLLQSLLNDEQMLQHWFGRFATQLDPIAHQALPEPLSEEESASLDDFIQALAETSALVKDPVCRFAYQSVSQGAVLFINGYEWTSEGVDNALIIQLANSDSLPAEDLHAWFKSDSAVELLYQLWQRQFIVFAENLAED